MRRIRLFQVLLSVQIIFCSLQSMAFKNEFPMGPNPELTPGDLCHNPDAYRYPEKIPYCKRSVSSNRKWEIIGEYNETLGYHIDSKSRKDYKIDHLIPLCIGGGNSSDNLWPQHKSIYVVTDPLEHEVCRKVQDGMLLQKEAISIILEGKNNLSKVQELLRAVEEL